MSSAADPSAPLQSRVAVVTGGASGIGLAAAHRFAALGLRVGLADLDEEALDRAVATFDDYACCGYGDPASGDKPFIMMQQVTDDTSGFGLVFGEPVEADRLGHDIQHPHAGGGCLVCHSRPI